MTEEFCQCERRETRSLTQRPENYCTDCGKRLQIYNTERSLPTRRRGNSTSEATDRLYENTGPVTEDTPPTYETIRDLSETIQSETRSIREDIAELTSGLEQLSWTGDITHPRRSSLFEPRDESQEEDFLEDTQEVRLRGEQINQDNTLNEGEREAQEREQAIARIQGEAIRRQRERLRAERDFYLRAGDESDTGGSDDGDAVNEEELRNHERRLAQMDDRAGLRNLRIKPPIFNGKKGQNIKQFFSKLEKYLEAQGIDEDNRIEATGLCFEDDALEHFDSFMRANEDATYEEIKEAMTNRYDQDKIAIVIRSRISKRVLKKGESVSDYFNELRREANKIDMPDDAFLFAFIQGLPKASMRQIVVQNPETPDEALAIAKTLEQIEGINKPEELVLI